VAAGLAHESLVAGGQGGVGLAGVVGGQEQRLAEAGVAVFGRAAAGLGEARGVLVGDQSGEGPGRGQAGEPLGVAEAAADLAGKDLPHTRHRQQDVVGVGVAVVVEDPLIKAGDLTRELQGEAGLGGDVGGQSLIVQAGGSPQRQGGLGGGDDRVGSPLAPGLAGLALEPAGQPGPADALDLVGLAQPARNLNAVWVMSEPKAATQSGPRISSRASRRCMQAVRRRTRPDRSFTARLSGSPGPLVVSGWRPSGCSSGSRASSSASSRSVLVCLA
jgi:hypothetical protein